MDNPKLFVEGYSRFDVQQGELGDCWLLAAVANLTMHRRLFFQVVPTDQDFEEQYAGVFHFRYVQPKKNKPPSTPTPLLLHPQVLAIRQVDRRRHRRPPSDIQRPTGLPPFDRRQRVLERSAREGVREAPRLLRGPQGRLHLRGHGGLHRRRHRDVRDESQSTEPVQDNP